MGYTEPNGDEDRGYNPGSSHGGLSSSGGREDLSEHRVDLDQNPFAGGYSGGNAPQPPASQTQQLGLNTPDPTPQEPQH